MIYLLSGSQYNDDLVTLGYATSLPEIEQLAVKAYRELYPGEEIACVSVNMEEREVRVREVDDFLDKTYYITVIPHIGGDTVLALSKSGRGDLIFALTSFLETYPFPHHKTYHDLVDLTTLLKEI